MSGLIKKEKQDKGADKLKRVDTSNHTIKKRPAPKPQRDPTAIYVSRKTNLKGLLAKCEKLLKDEHNELTIHCMGASIRQGILLALELCDRYTLDYVAETSTVSLIDDLVPTNDEADYEVSRRDNSALKVRVFRPSPNIASTSSSCP